MSSARRNWFSRTIAYPPKYSRLSISLSGSPVESTTEIVSHAKCESVPLKHTSLPDSKHYAFCTYLARPWTCSSCAASYLCEVGSLISLESLFSGGRVTNWALFNFGLGSLKATDAYYCPAWWRCREPESLSSTEKSLRKTETHVDW